MPSLDSLFNAFVTILVTIDPPGLAPLFLALTRGMNRDERRQVGLRASIIGFAVLALFAVAGASILAVFGITLPAFRVAGGFLLFYIAFEMIFERRQERKEKTSETAITRDHMHNIAVFPLALPLIAGPGAISATILLSDSAKLPSSSRRRRMMRLPHGRGNSIAVAPHLTRHPGESRDLGEIKTAAFSRREIPAFAGMTRRG